VQLDRLAPFWALLGLLPRDWMAWPSPQAAKLAQKQQSIIHGATDMNRIAL
jgi:hypothetical protein